MKSKKVNEILKIFMEPMPFHNEVWIIRPKFNNYEIIFSTCYSKCWEEAEKQIKQHKIEIYGK